jgi:hypothetical protein
MKTTFTVLAAAMLASCGGHKSGSESDDSSQNNNGNGTAGVTGNILKRTLSTQEALSMPISSADCGRPFGNLPNATGTLIWMSSISETCSLQGNPCRVQPNALTLVLIPWNAASSGAPPDISPGVYPVTPNADGDGARGAFVEVLSTDASCNLTSRLPGATSGNVTITAVHGSALSGTFEVKLTDGEIVTGSFKTVECKLDTSPVCEGVLACSGTLQCG